MGRSQTNQRSLQNLRPWKPGQSGNPGGQPRGFVSEIRRQTKNGFELVSFALRVLRNEEAEMRDRAWACGFLADRGFGKPTQSLDLEVAGEPMVPLSQIQEAGQAFRDKFERYVRRDGAGDGQREHLPSAVGDLSPTDYLKRELLGDTR
jgi:hypothetical protein